MTLLIIWLKCKFLVHGFGTSLMPLLILYYTLDISKKEYFVGASDGTGQWCFSRRLVRGPCSNLHGGGGSMVKEIEGWSSSGSQVCFHIKCPFFWNRKFVLWSLLMDLVVGGWTQKLLGIKGCHYVLVPLPVLI